MDNENTVTDLKTGNVLPFTPYMHLGEDAEQADMFEVDDTVNIPRGEYEDLIEDSTFLHYLEEAGVDSWEGYGEALSLFENANEEGEDAYGD